MRKFLLPGVDLLWVGCTPFLALLLRENFESTAKAIHAIEAYAGLSVMVAAFVFAIAGLNRDIWSYASLSEVLRIIAAVTIAILLSLCATFVLNRLDGIARSLPIIQWLLLVAGMMGTRVVARLLRRQAERDTHTEAKSRPGVEHVLIVGLNHVTELYLQSVAEFASGRISVVGILAPEELRGRLIQFHKIVGSPEELPQILAQYSVHGVSITRLVITVRFDQLSAAARETLLRAERSAEVKLDFFAERIGLVSSQEDSSPTPQGPDSERGQRGLATCEIPPRETEPRARYGQLKRIFDLIGSIVLLAVLSPIFALSSLLVVLDVGLPLTFWQLRPGRHGRPFRLYKFRTMAAAHDRHGARIPDSRRLSPIGRLLRQTRLDELPQLYNVVVGEMSLVGPRPLLPIDLAADARIRLSVRPGVTGWAQVNGGREVAVEDKDALDRWYVRNMSFALDVKILLRTLGVVLQGERVNHIAVRTARRDVRAAAAKPVPDAPRAKLKEVGNEAA